MKNYLDLVPISAKIHKKQNRMSIFCIFLAVFLVTSIFGMADMFIRCQFLQAQMDDGMWHIVIKNISDEQAALISVRPEIQNLSCYGVINYSLDMGYTLQDKEVLICGSDENYLTEMEVDAITEGSFPQNVKEALVCEYARDMMGLKIGDLISVCDPNGTSHQYTVSGFSKNAAKAMKDDVYFIFLTTEAYRDIFPDASDSDTAYDMISHDPAAYDSVFFVQFADHGEIQKTIADIKTQFSLSDEQIIENAKVLALLGQSGNEFIMQIYMTAAILSVLVLLAGILMITSSLNSNVAGRTEFFGMLRCIGATPKQIMRLVRREAFSLCGLAIPSSIAAGVIIIWALCAILRYLSPQYFMAMPAWDVSVPSIAAGLCVGILTVLLAARSPAKKASNVSPLTAVTGSANNLAPARKAANTTLFKVDTALGIHHAKTSRKNFLLVTGSFSLSIILFLSFTVTIDFMKHALSSLYPWTPDLTISGLDNTRPVDSSLLNTLQENPVVKRVFGRMAVYNIPFTVNGTENIADLISYEKLQFEWSESYLTAGSLEDVQNNINTGLIVYTPQYGQEDAIQVGDILTLNIDGKLTDIKIAGIVSKSPYNINTGSETQIIICSEETFRELTKQTEYTVIDIQLTRKARTNDINEIHTAAGTEYAFSDNRMGNDSAKGAYYSFGLFLYGFLILIGLITIFNIINCIAMNVAARMKQYGALRAVGLSNRQLTKMVIAEASTYALIGSACGGILGVAINRILFDKLVTFHWGTSWDIPWTALGIITAIVVISVILAVWNPLTKLYRMSIVDTISAE